MTAGRDGQEATGLRHLRRTGRISRPPALLPLLAPYEGGSRQGPLPLLRSRPRAAGQHRPVHHLFARLQGMRSPGPVTEQPTVPGLPAQGNQRTCPRWKAGLSAREDRLVRSLFTAPAGEAPAEDLPRMRAVAAPFRAGAVLGLLAKAPRPSLHPRRTPSGTARRPAELARRFRRPGRCWPLRRQGLRLRHRPGAAPGGRALQLATGPAGAVPQARTVDGLFRPRPRGLLHPPRPGPAHRPGRTTRSGPT